MAHWLLILSADLKRQDGIVCVGPETANICAAAARAARHDSAALLCAPAGWSTRYGVHMGDGPVRAHLRDALHIDTHRIATPPSNGERCNTNGEMETFARLLFRRDSRPAITVFVRHWHAPRALRLLQARLDAYAIRPTNVTVVRVDSNIVFDRMLEPLKLLNEVRRGNLGITDLFSTPAFS